MRLRTGLLLVFLGLVQIGFAQIDTIYNTNSPLFRTPERIAYYEQLYRFRVTRFVDLAERQNSGFSSRKSNIAKLILDLVRAKKIGPYNFAFGDPANFEEPMADSLALFGSSNYVRDQTRGNWSATESYQQDELVIVMEKDPQSGIPDEVVYKALQPTQGNDPLTSSGFWASQGPLTVKLSAQNIKGIEIVEDVIFDKRKSRLTYDILAIGVDLEDPNGGVQPRFFVKYADLGNQIDRLAKSKSQTERASVMWQNRYNPSESKKFTDALKLRLFHGTIKKVENPDDMSIMDIIYDKSTGRGSYAEGVFAMWEKEMEMMEKEHNLWEF